MTRSGNGVLTSDSQSRDIHIDSYSLSFHGRLLIENATFSLNYGQRYVALPPRCAGWDPLTSCRQLRTAWRERFGKGESVREPGRD